MVEASGPRSLSGGEEQVPAARARSACGDRQRCPFPIHFPWPGIRRATQQGGTRARGGQLRPAPPRTPRAARARAARQEAPGTQGREGSRAGRDVGSATRVWPASGDTRRPPLGPALARTSGRFGSSLNSSNPEDFSKDMNYHQHYEFVLLFSLTL